MDVLLLMDEQPPGAEVAGDVPVAVLDEPPAAHSEDIRKRAVGSHGVDELRALSGREPHLLGDEHGVVDFAEGRSDVNDAGARVRGHEVGGDDTPGGGLRAAVRERCAVGRARGAERIERRQVAAADEGRARQPFDHIKLLLEFLAQRCGKLRGDDVFRGVGGAGLAQHRVVEVGPHGGKLVRGERPRGRGPGDETPVRRFSGAVEQWQGHVHAGVGHLPVTLPHLAAGEGGAPLRPPPDDLMALVEESTVEELGERPPDALHE